MWYARPDVPGLREGLDMRTRMLVTAGLIALTSVMAPGALIIDDFNGAQSLAVHASGPANDASTVPVPGVVGGLRGATLDYVSGPLGATLDIDPGGSGILTASSDAITSAAASTGWDGGSPATGLGGIDLTEGGAISRFRLGVLFDDLPTTITLWVYTDSANWATADLLLPGGIYSSQEFLVPFASFGGGGGTVDFTNVGAIAMEFNLDPSTDLALDFIKTDIPEPATIGLLAMGSMALIRIRKQVPGPTLARR